MIRHHGVRLEEEEKKMIDVHFPELRKRTTHGEFPSWNLILYCVWQLGPGLEEFALLVPP